MHKLAHIHREGKLQACADILKEKKNNNNKKNMIQCVLAAAFGVTDLSSSENSLEYEDRKIIYSWSSTETK